MITSASSALFLLRQGDIARTDARSSVDEILRITSSGKSVEVARQSASALAASSEVAADGGANSPIVTSEDVLDVTSAKFKALYLQTLKQGGCLRVQNWEDGYQNHYADLRRDLGMAGPSTAVASYQSNGPDAGSAPVNSAAWQGNPPAN